MQTAPEFPQMSASQEVYYPFSNQYIEKSQVHFHALAACLQMHEIAALQSLPVRRSAEIRIPKLWKRRLGF
jgi:hypothetical protein